MNLEKFTDRAKGFLQSAQTVAIRMNHQRISPEHLPRRCSKTSRAWPPG
jgi:ATP-dependent Clp protease ATP-binding subunit ClpB